MRLVDGGYLSWCYGVFPGAWDQGRFQFRNDLILLDSPEISIREQIYAGYKQHRRERVSRDPERERKRRRVTWLQEILRQETVVTVNWLPGYEADDLLALLWLQKREEISGVVAVDKDLLQIPDLWRNAYDLEGRRVWEQFSGRQGIFPRSIGLLRDEREFLLAQCLLGDESDSVPRLLPIRDFETFYEIRDSVQPFRSCWEKFGDDLLRNLELLLLPHPSLLREKRSVVELLEVCDSGEYWRRENFVEPELCSSRDWEIRRKYL